MEISEFKGLTFTKIEGAVQYSEAVLFFAADGRVFAMTNSLGNRGNAVCTWLEEVHGDIDDLVKTPILTAYQDTQKSVLFEESMDSEQRWAATFYRLRTINGTVTLRWAGTSNGYYSEEVEVCELSASDLKELQDSLQEDPKTRRDKTLPQLMN